MSVFERLDLTGVNVTQTGVNYEGTILSAEFGSGYRATAVTGLPVREWALEAEVLPDSDEYLIGLESRALYLWRFYRRHMDAGQQPFWLRDSLERKSFLAEFVDLILVYEVFTEVLYSTGLTVRQRRVWGVEGETAVTDEENPDSI